MFLCFTRSRYQVSVYRTNGPLVTIYRRGGHLGHVTKMPRTNFRSPYPRRLLVKFGFDRQAVLEKKMFEIVYDGRRRTDAGP